VVKKFPVFYGTRKFVTAFASARKTEALVNILQQHTFFYCKELLAPRPSPKLEDRPLSVVRDCLFYIFAATLSIGGRSSIRNVMMRRAVVTGTHLSWDHRQYRENLRVNAIKMSPKFCRLTFKSRASYI